MIGMLVRLAQVFREGANLILVISLGGVQLVLKQDNPTHQRQNVYSSTPDDGVRKHRKNEDSHRNGHRELFHSPALSPTTIYTQRVAIECNYLASPASSTAVCLGASFMVRKHTDTPPGKTQEHVNHRIESQKSQPTKQ